MTTVTYADVSRVAHVLAADTARRNPGVAESACQYFDEIEGAPSCLVGNILAEIAPELFRTIAARENEQNIDAIVRQYGQGDWFTIEPYAVTFLSAAQDRADNGETWAFAVTYAESVLDGTDIEV